MAIETRSRAITVMQAASTNVGRPRSSSAWRLAPPRQYAQVPNREAVLRKLDEAMRGAATAIVGSPGYGKTTLLVQWYTQLRARGLTVAWYTASIAEREPEAFLTMLIAALHAADVNVSRALLSAPERLSAQVLLDALVLDLKQAPTRVEIILDDFDSVDQPAITELLSALVHNASDILHVTLACRRQPSLATAKLQAQGFVHVVDSGDLSLTTDELADALSLSRDSSRLEEIASATKGWPVAVQLYGIALRGTSDESNLRKFTGATAQMAEYIAEQVFANLPRICQDAIIDLSPIENIEPGLADYVRCASDSAAVLELLVSLLPGLMHGTVVNDVRIYRCHPLLRDYAIAKASQAPEQLRALNLRAAHWFWSERRYAPAISHASRAGDQKRLRDMLGSIPIADVFMTSGASELKEILRHVPGSCFQSSERVRLIAALVHCKAGYLADALAELRSVRQDFANKETNDRTLIVDRLMVEMMIERHFDGSLSAFEARVARLRQGALDDVLVWALCDCALTAINQHRGNFHAAQTILARSKHIYAAAGGGVFAEVLQIHDLLLLLARGSLREAAKDCSLILQRKSSGQSHDDSACMMARFISAAIEYQHSFNLRCADAIQMAVQRLGEDEASHDHYAISCPIILQATWCRQGLSDALDQIEAIRKAAAYRGMAGLDGIFDACEILFRSRSGDISGATRLASDSDMRRRATAANSDCSWREQDLSMQALITLDLVRGAHEEAATMADELCRRGRRGGRRVTEIKGLVLGALAAERLGLSERAGALLRDAMGHAYQEKVVAAFAEEGSALVPLIERTMDGDQPARVRQHATDIVNVIRNARPFSLTRREAEILAYISAGDSNKTIAKRLGVSDNTIKFHLKQVYAKLGVSSRREAAAYP